MLRESASLREEGIEKEIPVSVDRKRAVRLLHTEEIAIDVGAVDRGIRTDDCQGVDCSVRHHGVWILRSWKEDTEYFEMTSCIATQSTATRVNRVDSLRVIIDSLRV